MLSLPQLESYLWQAAQLLRGSVDSGDFKHYILALLFYKRLCDVWDEADSGKARMEIPRAHHWSELRAREHCIGQGLHAAFSSIEQHNPALTGVFRGLDFTDAKRFPDVLLARLLEHFDLHKLGHSDVEQDVLGRAYEYMIAKFADDAGKKGGEFYTPPTVAALMAKCLAPEPGMSVYDPTCGSGGLLLEAARYLQAGATGMAPLRLHGQEKNLNTWAICKMNMFLHGLAQADIRQGDTLHEPAHRSGSQLHRFDRVIANPPFSLKSWGALRWRSGDPFQRNAYGCPPDSVADFAFVQHMLASLRPDGVMAVVLPCGILFREKAEGKIRRKLIAADQIETIVALPRNLFYGTGIPTCLLIARRSKAQERAGKILFVDAGDGSRSVGKHDELSAQGMQRVVELVHDWSPSDDAARVVTHSEIAEQDHVLTVQRYLCRPTRAQELFSSVELEELRAATAARDEAESLLFDELRRLGYE